jgi:Anti-sigma-K factor rskA/Putative zinc-finger
MSADLHTLTGAYAAHALSDGERLAFERHLAACPACAQEVRELTGTAARLGAAVAAHPPAVLWERVRAEAVATRQLAPVVGRAERRRRVERARALGLLGGRRRFPPLLAAAAALLVAAVSVTALNLGLPGRTERPVDLVEAVLGAPDARRVVAALPGGPGQAAVVVSRQQGRAVFQAGGLPPAPAGRTYQLWVVDRSGPRPAGLVEAGGGRLTRLLDGRVAGTEQVAMTVERRGGVARPTSEPVVVVDLEA